MSKMAVIYWSMTGNTEAMAAAIAQGAQEAGAQAELKQVSEISVDEALTYDLLALGCPAMGAEVLEEAEFEPFFAQLEGRLSGRKVALFGSYDWNDGEWMELWEQRADEAGLNVVDSVIAKDYPDDDAAAECMRLGALLA